MQKNRIVILMLGMFSVLTAYAQYPSLTKAERDRDHYIDSITKAHSDSAWQVAWPIVEKETREGRPFIPWASRSSDLPQADIPAFPGAVSHRIIKTEMNLSPEKVKRYGHVYCEGNIMEGFPAITADNWKGGVQIESLEDVGGGYTNIERYINGIGAKD